MNLFYPDFAFSRVTAITPEWLAQEGICALLLDVDNTLTTHGSPDVSPEVVAWLDRMRESGIRLLILSNNRPSRVAPLAAALRLEFVANAAKPLGLGARRATRQLGAQGGRIALVGDQIFTDVLCAKRAGMAAILVQPIEAEHFPFFKLKRRLERWVLRGYRPKNGGKDGWQ